MRVTCIGVVFAIVAGSATMARADVNRAPIALPVLGTQGPGSVYPSTIEVVAVGGTGQTGRVAVTLWGVTHPCPRDLAVLLVHNTVNKYLLMSNAGACRPLQGTSLFFTKEAVSTIPSNPPSSPPFGEFEYTLPANYGAQPAFPAPAPAGPYTAALPSDLINVNGTWSLYVFDTTDENRGVIAGGWSFHYDTSPPFESIHSNVRIPAAGTMGPAEQYPMIFNLATVPAGLVVHGMYLDITLHHTLPDNLRIALQSPDGTTVIVMANAGGTADIPAGYFIRFADDAVVRVPDNGSVDSPFYQPGSAYGTGSAIALGAPAPQPPYQTSFSAFDRRPARGLWGLWVYDDANTNIGEIESATLTLNLEPPLPSDLTFVNPLPGNFTTTQPFVRFEGVPASTPPGAAPYAYIWRNFVNGEFYDWGAFLQRPGTGVYYADIPMKRGANDVRTTVVATNANGHSTSRTITVDEFTYSLAEGATGSFFDMDVTLANPSSTAATVAIDFLAETGGVVQVATAVSANRPLQLNAENYLPANAMSTVIHSTNAVPLAVERTMSWDASGYGGHGGTAVSPSARWLFAEGSQGYFQTYVLLANDNASAVDVVVDFLLEGGGVHSLPVSVPAKSRHTIYAGSIPELVNRSFGIDVHASAQIIAERAMYLPGPHLFEGGHESAGVTAPSRNWFLAEGATGNFFDCFVLLSNPSSVNANVTLTYLLPSGDTVVQDVVVPADGRLTINVETVDAKLTNTPVSTSIASDISIVAERAMYWPDAGQGWQEAHNSFGVTDTALRWAVADGRIGGPRAHQTYILLANPNPQPAEVEVRFLKSTFAVSRSYTLPPTSRLNIWANGDVPELTDGVFSAEVRVLNYQPIAVEKALYWDANGVTWAGGTNVTATRLPPP